MAAVVLSPSTDFQAVFSQFGMRIRLRILGDSVGIIGETEKDRGIVDQEESDEMHKAGSCGSLFWAPRFSLTACGKLFEGDEYNLALHYNKVRIVGQRCRTFFNGRTIPFGEDGYRLVLKSDIDNTVKTLKAHQIERSEHVNYCAERLPTMITLQRRHLVNRLTSEATKAFAAGKITSIEEHVKECLERVDNEVPSKERFLEACRLYWLETEFSTPKHLLNDPEHQKNSQAEYNATCKAAGEFLVEKVKSCFTQLQENKSLRLDSIKRYRRTMDEFLVLNQFVNNSDVAEIVTEFDNYCASLGFNTEKEGDLKRKVEAVRKGALDKFKAKVLETIALIDEAEVVAANPFASKDRLVL